MSINIDIQKFDPRKLKHNTCLIVGKRSTGKTTLINKLLGYLDYSDDLVFSGVERDCVHTKFDSKLIDKFIDNQKESKKPGVVIFDDMTWDHSVFRSKSTRNLILNSKFYKTNILVGVSYCMDIPPDIRANVDYIFIFKENITENIKKLWKWYGGLFDNFEVFHKTVIECTKEFDCLVIDNTNHSYEINESVFWYNALASNR